MAAVKAHPPAVRGGMLDLRTRRMLAPFTVMVAIWAVAYVWYNFARWGLPYDVGYTAWYHLDSQGSPIGSPFQLQYFSYELTSFFVNLPERLSQAPWFTPGIGGQCLEFTSPALILAFFARGARPIVALLWLATALVAAPSFIYYVDGFAQFGMRHALDFEPFLFALMALAVRRGMPWWGKTLCGYSTLVGAWGVWYWHTFIRQG
jgi:hypothetical protein